MVAAVLGASAVVLTDMEEALGPPRRSVAQNCALWDETRQQANRGCATGGASCSDEVCDVGTTTVTVEPLMWGEGALPKSIVASGCGDVDVVIAADVLGATADGMIDGENHRTHNRGRLVRESAID